MDIDVLRSSICRRSLTTSPAYRLVLDTDSAVCNAVVFNPSMAAWVIDTNNPGVRLASQQLPGPRHTARPRRPQTHCCTCCACRSQQVALSKYSYASLFIHVRSVADRALGVVAQPHHAPVRLRHLHPGAGWEEWMWHDCSAASRLREAPASPEIYCCHPTSSRPVRPSFLYR